MRPQRRAEAWGWCARVGGVSQDTLPSLVHSRLLPLFVHPTDPQKVQVVWREERRLDCVLRTENDLHLCPF